MHKYDLFIYLMFLKYKNVYDCFTDCKSLIKYHYVEHCCLPDKKYILLKNFYRKKVIDTPSVVTNFTRFINNCRNVNDDFNYAPCIREMLDNMFGVLDTYLVRMLRAYNYNTNPRYLYRKIKSRYNIELYPNIKMSYLIKYLPDEYPYRYLNINKTFEEVLRFEFTPSDKFQNDLLILKLMFENEEYFTSEFLKEIEKAMMYYKLENL